MGESVSVPRHAADQVGDKSFKHRDRGPYRGSDRNPFGMLALSHFAFVCDRSHAIAFDHTVFATGQRQAPGPHRLYFAVAHTGEIGADDVARSLQHALFLDERPGIEARPPGPSGIGVAGNRGVHPTDFDANLVDGGGDNIGKIGRGLQRELLTDVSVAMPVRRCSSCQLMNGAAAAPGGGGHSPPICAAQTGTPRPWCRSLSR